MLSKFEEPFASHARKRNLPLPMSDYRINSGKCMSSVVPMRAGSSPGCTPYQSLAVLGMCDQERDPNSALLGREPFVNHEKSAASQTRKVCVPHDQTMCLDALKLMLPNEIPLIEPPTPIRQPSASIVSSYPEKSR